MGRLRLHHLQPTNTSRREVAPAVAKKGSEASKPDEPSDAAEHLEDPFLSTRTKASDLLLIPPAEVKKNNGVDGRRLFIVVDNIVLDCTTYLPHHPGGASIIRTFGGQDCSWQWWTFHNRHVFNSTLLPLRVGRTLDGEVQNPYERPSRAWVGLRGFGYRED